MKHRNNAIFLKGVKKMLITSSKCQASRNKLIVHAICYITIKQQRGMILRTIHFSYDCNLYTCIHTLNREIIGGKESTVAEINKYAGTKVSE